MISYKKNILLSLLLLLSVFVNAQDFKKNMRCINKPCKDYVLVVSHRGNWRYAPENSLEAIKRCIDLGVDIVEIDVRLTKDGHMVLMHDKTVDRTTNGKGAVKDLTLQEIKKLRLRNAVGIKGSQFQVPTLEEVMLLAKGKILINLDKTEGETVREAYKVLKKTGTVNQAIFKANNTYAFMRKKYGKLMDSIFYMPKLWSSNKTLKSYRDSFEKGINPTMYEILFETVEDESFKMIPQIKKSKNNFLAIALWDKLCAGHTDERAIIDGADASWGWLINQGANAIMTDRPELLLEYLRKRGLHK